MVASKKQGSFHTSIGSVPKTQWLTKAKWLAGASAFAASTAAMAAPPLILTPTGQPTVVGAGLNERALWSNAGTVGGQNVDIVAEVVTGTIDHELRTDGAGYPSILSRGVEDIWVRWYLYRAGTHNITTNSGGTPVVADVHIQFNDIDGPNNERVYVPVCSGAVQWVRIDADATTGRAFGTVAGRNEIFSLIGDQNYAEQPISGLEIFYPDSSTFEMGRRAIGGPGIQSFRVIMGPPTYSAFDTLDYECGDFVPPIANDDSQEGIIGTPTVINILNNDSNSTNNDNGPNNNTLLPSEFAKSTVSLVAPAGATGIQTDAKGDVIGFTVPGEGAWAYNDNTGELTFTPDPSFKGSATQIDYTFDNALGVPSNAATVTVWYPAIGVVKSATFNDANSDGFAQVGETIDYIYTVNSYGIEPLENITISETGFTGAGTAPTPVYSSGDTNSDNRLDLTETWIYTATYALIAADLTGTGITNSATAGGQTAGGTSVSDVSDSSNPADGNGSGTSGPGPDNGDPTVTPFAIKPIAASNDSQTGTIFANSGAASAYNVFDNDTLNSAAADPSNVALTITTPASNAGVTLDTATGLVSVAPGTPAGSYTIDYQICEIGNPSNCANAQASVVVTAATPISAATDSPPAVPSVAGGSDIVNALANDMLNGNPVNIADVNLTVVTPAANPGVTLDTATGLVSVAPGTPADSYSIEYQICEAANPSNCAISTINVVVNATPILADNDSAGPVNGNAGSMAVINAFTNDRLNNAPINAGDITATVTAPAAPINGGPVPTLNPASGDVDVPAGTPAGSYVIGYEICETASPANCESAQVTVNVVAAPIAATNDNTAPVNSASGGANLVNVLGNDSLDSATPTPAVIDLTIVTPASNAGVTLDPATGNVSAAPGTPAGNYSIVYQICDALNPANCAMATVTIPVGASPITANTDSPAPVSGISGGNDIINAFDNDRLNGQPVDPADITATITTPATPASPGASVPVLDPATGLVDVPAGTPAGTYTINYQICETLNPSNCANSSVMVVVTAAPISADADTPAPVNGTSGGNDIINAFDNDRLNGQPVDPADVTATVTTPATPASPGAPIPALDPATGLVDVPAGTPAGTYTINYQICETLNPANCADSVVTVVVDAAPIAAQNDSAGPVTTAAGGANLIDALANDSLNNIPVVLADIDLTVTSPASNPGVTLDPATGQVSVAPGTPAGNYTIGYQICEKLNPANCATATVAVAVNATPIAASNDMPAPVNGTDGNPNAINAFTNDQLNGQPVDPADIIATITTPASNPGVVIDPVTGTVSVAPGTPAGSYAISYEICERGNPANCQSAVVNVVVEASAILADADTPAPVNGTSGGNDIINAFDNDRLNGQPVDPADITATITTPATPASPGASVPVLDPATGLVDVPAGTPAGTYTINYQICETLNPANCADSVVTVVVEAAPIAAQNDSAGPVTTAAGGANLIDALANDSLNNIPVVLADIDLTVTSPASNPGVTLDPATGQVSVAPGTPAGNYTIGYQICEKLNPANCATATVAVAVTATPIAANADTPAPVNGTSGGSDIINAFDNDRLNGQPVDPADITATITTPATPASPGAPVPMLDPATGLVDVPAGTPAGTYTINYQICETLNPANCADSVVTVVVDAAPIAAQNDTPPPVNGLNGASNIANIFGNDTLNGAAATAANVTLSVTSPAANPGVTLDPVSGNVSVAPGTPAGTYSIGYEICERLNPSNCATATVIVVVESAAINAAPDTPAPVNGANGGSDIINAFGNDRLNGNPVDPADITATITAPAAPANPGASVPMLDPATGLVDVPAGTPAGTYTIGYEICERLNPANCAQSEVTVVVEAPAITAATDMPAPIRSGIGNPSAINAFANDTLNGQPVDPAAITATILTPATDPGVALDPATGNVSVDPTVPAGTYTIEYQICERLNPTNCAISTVTVVVEPPVGGISGTVYTDLDGDRIPGEGEPRRAGWTVEIVHNGAVVATAISDAEGNYSVPGLSSGPGYEVRFRSPENNVVYDVIRDMTVGNNQTLVDQNQPIDPSGVIYNSVTRTPISGATATLTGTNGLPLPDICFVSASQQNQTTGASGEYRFDIVPGAAPQCPVGETEYRITVNPPAGFANDSSVILPQAGPFDPTGLSAPVRISPENGAPLAADPVFYLNFRLANGDPDIINNHIALDPFTQRPPLIVTKTSPKRTANVGDVVPYEITVRNADNVRRAGVDVVDILPPGMKYVLGTATVNGTAQEPEATNGNRQLVWRSQVIPANGSVKYNLALVVGAGVTGGEKVNTGLAQNTADGTAISNRGTSVVQIVPSAVFDCSELLGKVFEDTNRNGYQDEGEPGVPAVRLATVNGQLITTDEYGRYHIACAAVPDARIGSNYVLKLDTRTLPLGWEPTTDNPRSIRLTRGKFGELNFGVAPKEPSANRDEKGE
ncbi:hypothetical protein ACFOWX_02205 [Sphingorhabdus arenilitoris]|uniref:Tandem-95 repeat protein n=1 Tax=Sphingorhabdus arenilitoris TaxID=1490041 RepID=A0ABV8RG22_9SPHN